MNTGWLAAPQYQKIMAQGTDYFKLTIQNYLDARAREDELFAPRYANPKKNIDDCCTFIINQVRQSGCNGFADEEIYSMALHYYDEEGHRHRQTRQLQGSGQSHRRTDRGGKSRGTAERHTEGRERSLRQVGESQVQTQENRR